MATQLQLRRGTTAENNAYTGAIGELSYNTERQSLRVHDGNTPGGTSLSSLSMPSNNFIDIALPAAGGSYYAPADGFVYVQKKSTSNITTFQYLNLYNRTAANLCNTISTETGAAVINAWVPAKKGNRIEFQYNLGGDTVLCRFIYAQGAQ